MTAALPAAGAGEALPVLGDPAERGGLSIAERVVERVAGHAVTRVEGAGAAPRRVLGVRVGEAGPQDGAAVDAQLDGGTATVRATVAVAWPNPVRAVADRVRERIRADVALMTGVRVAQVDLDVVSFAVAATPARRVL